MLLLLLLLFNLPVIYSFFFCTRFILLVSFRKKTNFSFPFCFKKKTTNCMEKLFCCYCTFNKNDCLLKRLKTFCSYRLAQNKKQKIFKFDTLDPFLLLWLLLLSFGIKAKEIVKCCIKQMEIKEHNTNKERAYGQKRLIMFSFLQKDVTLLQDALKKYILYAISTQFHK